MDLWYDSHESAGVEFRVKVRRSLFSAESRNRRIDIFETEDFGRILALDGQVALSEIEGESLREMAVHVPLNVNPGAACVLVIGGGDGGILSELVRYPSIERITVVEPASDIIEATRRWFPAFGQAFADPRVRFSEEDGADFVRDTRERFDVLILDDLADEASGEGTFAQSFYCDCFRILSGDGILVGRAGRAVHPRQRRELVTRAGRLKRLFPVYRLYRSALPAGEPGEYFLSFASKRWDPVKDFGEAEWQARGLDTRYYTAAMHRAAFALPRAVEELLDGI
jgi:spermidine synthase